MTRPISITSRLVVALSAGAVVLWLLSASLAAITIRSSLDQAFDGGLRETAERLLPLALRMFDHDDDEAQEVPYIAGHREEYISYQVRAADGHVLLRSHDAPNEPFPAPLESDSFTSAGPWRIYTLGTPDTLTYVQVAELLDHRVDTLRTSLFALIWPIALLLPLAAVAIGLVVQRGLRPLTTMRQQIAERDAGNLAPIETQGLPRELAPIGDAIQGLIARLRGALEAERAFAANSAHELRTPIAGSLAQTQRLIEELEGSPAIERARLVEQSLGRLRQLADKLLALSRADAGMARSETSHDLLPALRLVVDDALRQSGQEARIRLEIASDARLVAPIDVDAFGIVMRNLIENALRHGRDGEPVTVAVPRSGIVEVSNAGEVVPPARLELLTSRFVRGSTVAPGAGLGLAIVETIIEQVGGRLELISPRPGESDGFCVRIALGEAAERRA